MSESIAHVLEQMRAESLTGITQAELIVDGNLHRFCPDWEPNKKKERAWYVLFPVHTGAGKVLVIGSFGWFKGADCFTFNVDLKSSNSEKLSAIDRDRIKQEQATRRQIIEDEQKLEAKRAADKALSIWNACGQNGHSKYLQRKKISALGVRFSRGSIVIPVLNFSGELCGLQFIDADGQKRFLTGTQKKGHFAPLGEVHDPCGYVGVAEGYATGASCHMATKWPVFVAFDAGNLKNVAMAVRGRYPMAKVIVFADDDVDNPENPGRSKAMLAARAVGGLALFPDLAEAT